MNIIIHAGHYYLRLREPHGDGLVDEVECHDEDEVDGGPGGGDEDGPVTPENKNMKTFPHSLPPVTSYLINLSVTVARATIMDIL